MTFELRRRDPPVFTRAPQEKGQRGGGGTEGMCCGDSGAALMSTVTFPLTSMTISPLWSSIYIMLVLAAAL